ncbi:MAG: DUF6265 family protein [Candidatus Acidiferrales bacterium]
MLFALQSPCANAQQPTGAGTQSATAVTAPAPPAAPATRPKATLADFAWLEGCWRGEWGPRIAEQEWLAPKAGVMTGQFRLVENDKTLVIELFTLVEKPQTISFYFRHFTPELVPWEKTSATVLNLVNSDGKNAEFDNPLNGLPKRASMVRVDADTYISRSEITPEEGEPQVTEITYHRQKPNAEKPSAGNGARR